MTKKEEATMELYRMIRPIEKNLARLELAIYGANGKKSKYPYEIIEAYRMLDDASVNLDWILCNLEDASSLIEDEIFETEEDYETTFEDIEQKLKKSSALLNAYMVDALDGDERYTAEFMKSLVTHALESLGRLSVIKLESEEKVG